jgi:glyoxylase-like metal-dependent hydrolase (beta-lactamase superfamily II)
VGPAHTLGDAVVWVPGDKTLFTGDILFKDAHPVIWQGPVSNWIAALRRLLDMDIETVVSAGRLRRRLVPPHRPHTIA